MARSGFARLTAEVARGHVGIVLGLEVSRLARDNADWHRLIDLAGISDTLIGDADGIYHPGHFNDRLLLGLNGTMSEAELHVLRARLNGGIRNKAARGELRRGLPVGFVWGGADGEVRLHPDEGVVTAIRSVFAKFAETGSARRVWLWFRSEGLPYPLQMHQGHEMRWVDASYTAIHNVLTNPEEVFLANLIQHRNRCPLGDLVLQCADVAGIMHLMQLAFGMRGEDVPSGQSIPRATGLTLRRSISRRAHSACAAAR